MQADRHKNIHITILRSPAGDEVDYHSYLTGRVLSHGEAAAGRRLPDILLVVIALTLDDHSVGDQVRRVEADAELADHRDVGAGLQRLHERLRARLGDRAEVVDHVGLGHAQTGVDDCY